MFNKNITNMNVYFATLQKWTIGAPCRAVYSEDGEVYEAIISKIFESSGTCIVQFVGNYFTSVMNMIVL